MQKFMLFAQTGNSVGPGGQTLIAGTPTLGFYGEVTTADLMTSANLASQIKELAGASVLDTTSPWLKFSYNGKTFFIAKKPQFGNVTWNQLYNAGLVDGSDDTGAYNPGVGVNQIRLVKTGNYTFKVRTITGDSVDPSNNVPRVAPGSSGLETAVHSSMWTDLLYGICSRLVGSYPSGKLWNYNDADLLNASYFELNRETVPSYTTTALQRGKTQINAYTSGDKGTVGAAWRPVLELVDANQIFSLVNVAARTASASAPVTGFSAVDSSAIQHLGQVTYKVKALTQSAGSAAIVSNTPIVAVGSVIYQTKGLTVSPGTVGTVASMGITAVTNILRNGTNLSSPGTVSAVFNP